MTSNDMRRWAQARETAYEIALAIHKHATAERDPQAIWEHPTPQEILAVRAQLGPGEYNWGAWTALIVE